MDHAAFTPRPYIQTSPSSPGVALPCGTKFHTHTKQQVKLYCKLLLPFAPHLPSQRFSLSLPLHSAEVSLRAAARCRESEYLCQRWNFFCKWIHRLWHLTYQVHNGPPIVPAVGQINLVHAFQSHFFDIHFNSMLSSPS
jgi:hypothetical protein